MLEDLFRTSPEKIHTMMTKLRAVADSLKLPFSDRTRTYNSRLAQELGLWAEDQGAGDRFHMAAFLAYFAKGLNLAKVPLLLDLVESIGLPRGKAESVLNNRTYSDKVDRDWRDSREKGITAVPTFVMGHHSLVGAQPYETLENLITINGAARK